MAHMNAYFLPQDRKTIIKKKNSKIFSPLTEEHLDQMFESYMYSHARNKRF